MTDLLNHAQNPIAHVWCMCWLKCDRQLLLRGLQTHTRGSATEAKAMSGYLFAVAGVEAMSADGRFDNDEQMQHMVHLLLEPRRARRLLDEADALEAQRFAHGVEGPAPPAAVVEEPATAMPNERRRTR